MFWNTIEIEWNRVLYWSQLKGSSALTIKKRQANRNSSDLLPLSPTPPLPRSSSLALHRLHGDVRLAHRLHLDPVWCLRGAQWVATLPSSPSNPPPPILVLKQVGFFFLLCIQRRRWVPAWPSSSRTPSSSSGESVSVRTVHTPYSPPVHWLLPPAVWWSPQHSDLQVWPNRGPVGLAVPVSRRTSTKGNLCFRIL